MNSATRTLATQPAATPAQGDGASPPARQRQRRDFLAALLFLAPNFLGFVLFVSFPLIFSFIMAFTNWRLGPEPTRFVGLDNFFSLLRDGNFWFYFANTGYFLMGIPIAICLTLAMAMILSRPIDIRSWKWKGILSAIVIGLTLLLLAMGLVIYGSDPRLRDWGGALAALNCLPGWLLILGFLTLLVGLLAIHGGIVAFRTLFYLPVITNGVAMMVLWKSLYRPQGGPINQGILALLDGMRSAVTPATRWLLYALAAAAALGTVVILARVGMRIARDAYNRVEVALGLAITAVAMALVMQQTRQAMSLWVILLPLTLMATGIVLSVLKFMSGMRFDRLSDSFFAALAGAGVAVLGLALVALFFYLWAKLPEMQVKAPEWLGSEQNLMGLFVSGGKWQLRWKSFGLGAREAIILMGMWIGLGGNTMLLYLAGLSNVPQELYEAADIDGASRWQRFWNVTWPQLAPTTFFIVVMATIGGLQGGFEQARVMTNGGPAETTTTLAYFIYTKAFEQYEFGYAAAVSWFLFLVIFLVTLVNWRFGNRSVNE